MSYVAQLSKTQYRWLIGTSVAATGMVALGWALEPRHEKALVTSFTTKMSIRESIPEYARSVFAQISQWSIRRRRPCFATAVA